MIDIDICIDIEVEDIPCRELRCHSFSEGIEGLFIELNFRKCKWMFLGTYHPPSQNMIITLKTSVMPSICISVNMITFY